MIKIGRWPMMSRSRPVFAVIASALALVVGLGAPTGSESPHQPVPSPPACDHTLTVGHVPGHVHRVWQLECTDDTTVPATLGEALEPTNPQPAGS